jgi:hypothetical protein
MPVQGLLDDHSRKFSSFIYKTEIELNYLFVLPQNLSLILTSKSIFTISFFFSFVHQNVEHLFVCYESYNSLKIPNYSNQMLIFI